MNTDNLNETLKGNFVLVKLSMGKWNPNKRDMAAAAELAASHGAVTEAYRTMKNIMAGADTELKEINRLQSQIRGEVYRATLPWSAGHGQDGRRRGPRLLAVQRSLDLIKTVGTLRNEFTQALDQFIQVYDQRVAQAIKNLGSGADPALYPPAHEVKERFYVTVELEPVPVVEDFRRLALPAEIAQALGEKLATRQQQVLEGAMTDLTERIAEVVGRMAAQMRRLAEGEKARLFQSLVGNVQDVARLVAEAETLGTGTASRLQALRADLDQLAALDLKKVRNAPAQAKAAAETAERVLTTLDPTVPIEDEALDAVYY